MFHLFCWHLLNTLKWYYIQIYSVEQVSKFPKVTQLGYWNLKLNITLGHLQTTFFTLGIVSLMPPEAVNIQWPGEITIQITRVGLRVKLRFRDRVLTLR